MSWDDTGDRSLPASPRRRAEARRQGHVLQSRDLASALLLGGVAVLLMWHGPGLVQACGDWLRECLATSPVVRGDELSAVLANSSLWPVIGTAVGLLGSLWLAAVIVRLVQVGPLFEPALVQPRGDRISLMSGFRRMFSASSAGRALLWAMRLIVVGGVVWWTLAHEAGTLAALSHQSPGVLALTLGRHITSFALRLCAGMLVLGAMDYAWQWWLHQLRLRMTPDEARAERRESERTSTRRLPQRPQVAQSVTAEGVRAV